MRPLPRLVLRGWLLRRGRTLLALGGVALGVAVLLAVRLANYSAVEAFARTLEMVSGRADIEVFAEGEGSLPAELAGRFSRLPGIDAAAPVAIVKGRAGQGRRAVRLLGVDMARDSRMRPWYSAELDSSANELELFINPRAVLMTPALADEIGLAVGELFPFEHTGRIDSLELVGLLEGEDVSKAQTRDILVMDLPRAWQLEPRQAGRLQRIDLLLAPGLPPDSALVSVRAMLPEGLRAERSGWRRPQAQKLLASFQLNLTALAFVALLVAGFLVYQTVAATALQRRQVAGVIRSVGGSRRFVRRIFLLEGLALGVGGALIGVPLGLLLARASVSAVATTVQSVYLLETTARLYVSAEAVFSSALLGLVVALLAVGPVAIETSRTPPRETASRQSLEEKMRIGLLTQGALALAALAAWLTWRPLESYPVLGGYAAAACWIFSAALITPALLTGMHALLAPFARVLPAAARLALGILIRSRHRVAPAVAALATATAMWLSVDMMVRSFRATVDAWVTGTITADLIVTSGDYFGVGKPELMPFETYERLVAAEGIADVDHFRTVRIDLAGVPTPLAMVDMASVRRQERLPYKKVLSGVDDPADAAVAGEDATLISETLAFRLGLEPGDTLRFASPAGDEALEIQGVYYDYSSDAGIALVDRAWFAERWGDLRLESIAVYLPEGVSLAEGRATVEQTLEGLEAAVFSNRQLRNSVLDVFDSTFAITYALEAVAVLVALLAVSGGLASLVMERTRELAILRAVGGSRRQTLGRVLVEAGLIGAAGWALGTVLGLLLAVVLTYVISLHSFGWTLNLQVPWDRIAQAAGLMIGAALIAGALPALRAARIPIGEGVRVEGD